MSKHKIQRQHIDYWCISFLVKPVHGQIVIGLPRELILPRWVNRL